MRIECYISLWMFNVLRIINLNQLWHNKCKTSWPSHVTSNKYSIQLKIITDKDFIIKSSGYEIEPEVDSFHSSSHLKRDIRHRDKVRGVTIL